MVTHFRRASVVSGYGGFTSVPYDYWTLARPECIPTPARGNENIEILFGNEKWIHGVQSFSFGGERTKLKLWTPQDQWEQKLTL